MTPKHDEIVRDIGNGFAIAWDTTRVDKALLAKMGEVVRKQSAALSEIIATKASASGLRDDRGTRRASARGRKSYHAER